jgi:hypothetical protein
MQAARALLLAFERVPFRWKDHPHGNKQKKMTLEAGVSAPLLSNAFLQRADHRHAAGCTLASVEKQKGNPI